MPSRDVSLSVFLPHHTESWLLSLYSALGFVYLGWTHDEYFPSRSLMPAFLYTAHTLPASGSVPAVYMQPTLQLHWLYTPLRSGLLMMYMYSDVRALTDRQTHTQTHWRDRFYTLDRWRGREWTLPHILIKWIKVGAQDSVGNVDEGADNLITTVVMSYYESGHYC